MRGTCRGTRKDPPSGDAGQAPSPYASSRYHSVPKNEITCPERRRASSIVLILNSSTKPGSLHLSVGRWTVASKTRAARISPGRIA